MSELLKYSEWAIIEAIYRQPDYRFYGKEALAAQKMSHRGLLRHQNFNEYKVTPQGKMLYEQEKHRQNCYRSGGGTNFVGPVKRDQQDSAGKNNVSKGRETVGDGGCDGGVEVYGPEQRMVHSRRRIQNLPLTNLTN